MMKCLRPLALIIIVSAFPVVAFCQKKDFKEELRFINYLLDKSLFSEAIDQLSRQDTSSFSPAERDEYFYTLGWAAYQMKKLDTSVAALMEVSPASEQFRKSRAFAAYNMAYNHRFEQSALTFAGVPVRDSIEAELILMEKAGLALLERNYVRYDSLRAGFTYSSYLFQNEEKRLDRYKQEMSGFKKRSMLLAGVYSAVLPGAGKWYAGKKKQGIAAFLPVVSLGAVAYEAYRKGGVKSARFIAFGSLFSLFYVGNIWGSVLSVKVRQHEFNREYENKVLFDMHIPLRNFYN